MKLQPSLLGLVTSVVLAQAIAFVPVLASLQTELTEHDLQRIKHLIKIAQRHSPTVREARANLRLAPFNEVVILGLGTNIRAVNTNEPDTELSQEQNLSAELYVDIVRTISALQSLPARRAQLQDTKRQVRVAVVQAYVAYLQAKQAQQIAAHRMQSFTTDNQTTSLDDEAYTTAATELLTANGNVQIALETLAATVGLSPEETLAAMESTSP